MFYKTQLKPEDIKVGQLFISTDEKAEEVLPGMITGKEEKTFLVDIGGEQKIVTPEEASAQFLFATIEDPQIKPDAEVAMYRGEGRLLDTLMYIRAQIMEIEKDPHYRMEITNEMLGLNLTRSLAAISIKIRLRGAWETLTNIEKMLTMETQKKEINS